jgi:hypothetical protein
VCRPFGGNGEGDSVGAELFHAQVTRNQGIFSYRQIIRCWGLDYIAENIDAPTVVLHYPSKRELIREIKTRHYTYIGINFVVATFHKLREMAKIIRRYSPGSKIILGGYGTVLSNDVLGPYGDIVCREEGIGFMRKLLGEKGTRLHHPYIPIESPRVYSYPMKTKVAHITGGLGCPNGCDFCCTSHYFRRKYIPFIKNGRDLFDTMQRMQRKAEQEGDTLSGFIFIDEDFFLYEKRAREYLECVRASGVYHSIMGFGSVRGLSQFTPDEIAEMGFDLIWTAFEGSKSGYKKLHGKNLSDLYAGLRARGVAILSSMIIGFPYHDRAHIMEDFRKFTALGPSLWQILIYFAFPGTPLYKRVREEKLYTPAYQEKPDYRTFDGFSMHFKHEHFTPEELETLQRDLYRLCFEKLGPSLVRTLNVWFEGYKNLRKSENRLLQIRAQRMADYVRDALPGIYPAMWFGPNRARRAEARAFLHEVIEELGPLSLEGRFKCLGTIPLSLWTWFAEKYHLFQQPRLLRVAHRLESHASSSSSLSDSSQPSFLKNTCSTSF